MLLKLSTAECAGDVGEMLWQQSDHLEKKGWRKEVAGGSGNSLQLVFCREVDTTNASEAISCFATELASVTTPPVPLKTVTATFAGTLPTAISEPGKKLAGSWMCRWNEAASFEWWVHAKPDENTIDLLWEAAPFIINLEEKLWYFGQVLEVMEQRLRHAAWIETIEKEISSGKRRSHPEGLPNLYLACQLNNASPLAVQV